MLCGRIAGRERVLAFAEEAGELRSYQNKQAIVSLVTEFAFYPKSFRKILMVLSGENNMIKSAGNKVDSGYRVELGFQGIKTRGRTIRQLMRESRQGNLVAGLRKCNGNGKKGIEYKNKI